MYVTANVYSMATKPRTKPKPDYGQRLEQRRGQVRKSLDDIADETDGVLYKQFLYRLENGRKKPSTLTVDQIGLLATALEWTPRQLADALNIVLPGDIVLHPPGAVLGPPITTAPELTVTKNAPGNRLKKLREHKDLTPEHTAELTGGAVSARRLRNLEEREGLWQKVREDEALALARVYGLSIMDFLAVVNGTPYPSRPNIYTDEVSLQASNIGGRRRIPVVDLLSAGPGGDGGNIVGYVDLEDEFKGPHSAYLITGDSMEPEIRDGETVIVQCQDYAPPKNTIVCWTPDDGMLCKYLDRVEDGFYVLTSLNPFYKPIWTREIHIYGIVVQSRKPFKVSNGNHN
jgi:phage repressor protein C with HTH and peptisase S24 domain